MPALSGGRGWRGKPGEADPCKRTTLVISESGPGGEQSESPPAQRRGGQRRPLAQHGGERGRLPPHALFPDSIHLSKLIFDIHSDLEGRHGDNSQKVENNIIATNMNYWPPG